MTKIFISNNPEVLKLKLAEFKRTATVEAEFGDVVVAGTCATFAHHSGIYQDNQAPCVMWREKHGGIFTKNAVDAIGISHFDLDTLGGIMIQSGIDVFSASSTFWDIAAMIDTSGPHRIDEFVSRHGNIGRKIKNQFDAFWAWSENNRLFPPRDGSIMDCTKFFHNAFAAINKILKYDFQLIDDGRKWANKKENLNINSFCFEDVFGGVSIIVRRSDSFVNHLYNLPDYNQVNIKQAVIAFNEKFKSITLSFEREGIGNACEIMQATFGLEAGGHAGIAGSPRGKEMSFDDIYKVLEHIKSND